VTHPANDEGSATATAVVIGGAGGIGHAVAQYLDASKRYGRVLTVDIAPSTDWEHIQVDLADEGERLRLIQRLQQSSPPFGAFVYSAGIDAPVECSSSAWQAWLRILTVNFIAAAQILCSLHDRFVADGTAVVLIDSVSAVTGSAIAPPYGASKAALRNLGRSLALRTGQSGARYNGVAPGSIDTPMARGLSDMLRLPHDRPRPSISGRIGRPEDIAAAVDFLCSPKAAYVNGSVLTVDDGYLAKK
jgi:NAD(P)-dependent dehydrogenase (short-subunit alcohol dehydrogenase family)